MKLVKINSQKECGLWEFVRTNLPSSLRATKFGDGYGTIYGIEVKERSDIIGYLPLTSGIATIGDGYIELRHPEWFSDFEDLVRKYEAKTGKEVEFRYWES